MNSKHSNFTKRKVTLHCTVQILRRLVTDLTCSKLDAYCADNRTRKPVRLKYEKISPLSSDDCLKLAAQQTDNC